MKKTCRYVVASQQQDAVSRQQGTTMTQREELILGVLVNVLRALKKSADPKRRRVRGVWMSEWSCAHVGVGVASEVVCVRSGWLGVWRLDE